MGHQGVTVQRLAHRQEVDARARRRPARVQTRLWRITLPANDGVAVAVDEVLQVDNGAIEALEMAKKQGKARFTGISTHNRMWLKTMIEQ